MAKYTGAGAILSTDFEAVKWVGKTKGGVAVTIELENAINLGNLDWAFAEKDDMVAEITFTACYDNTDDAYSTADGEPWSIDLGTQTAGAGEILLGAGIFYVRDTAIALTRGGGSFTVEHETREINADGDMGPVAGRITLDGSRATLTLNALTVLTRFADLYAGVKVAQ